MINCLVVGEQPTYEILKAHIEKFPLTTLIGHLLHSSKDLNMVLVYQPQIVFVDVSLIELDRSMLLRIAQHSTIIYIANSANHAFEAFEVMALDYLLKPLSYERFEKSINKFIHYSLLSPTPKMPISRKIDPITESFFIKADVKGQKEVVIKCHEVLFIEADQNYVFLHLIDGKKVLCHNTMKEMEESLPKAFFIRVHKSFIINYDKVTSIEGSIIILDYNEKQKILIGNTYRRAFFERKNQNMIRKHRAQLQPVDFYSSIA